MIPETHQHLRYRFISRPFDQDELYFQRYKDKLMFIPV